MTTDWKPRIAVCFSGLPRLVPASVESWMRFIHINDADVFAHTWVMPGTDLTKISKDITDRFKPRLVVTEPPRKINLDLYKDSDRIWPYRSEPKNVLSMWTSVRESILLSESWAASRGFTYDIVIRARFDWWCEVLTLEDNPGLTVPDSPGLYGHRFRYRGEPYVAHNDQFGYGKPDVMRCYANTINLIPRLFAIDGVDFCSELLLTASMMSQGIHVNYQKNMNCGIVK